MMLLRFPANAGTLTVSLFLINFNFFFLICIFILALHAKCLYDEVFFSFYITRALFPKFCLIIVLFFRIACLYGSSSIFLKLASFLLLINDTVAMYALC